MRKKTFIYWEPYVGNRGVSARKILLICRPDGMAEGRYDLTAMGLSHINTYTEFKKLFPKPYYGDTR